MADSKLRLQFVLEALDKVTGPLKNISGGLSAANRDLAKTHENLRKLDKAQKQIDNFKAREGRYSADIRQSEEATRKLEELRAKLAATETPTKKLRTELEKAERETKRLANAVDTGGAELQRMSAKLSAAGIDVADLSRHEDRLADSVYDANQALKKQQEQLEKIDKVKQNSEKLNATGQKAVGIGAGMTAAGIAVGLPMVNAVKHANAFETAMVGVKKRITFKTPDGFDKFSDDLLTLSARVPVAYEQLAGIASFGAGAKVPEKELLRFTESAAVMGVAFDVSAERAGEMMAQWRTALRLNQAEVGTLADKLNALSDGRGGDVGIISGMVSRVGSLAGVSGADGDVVGSMGHVMSAEGIGDDIGGTALKNFFLTMTKGKSATKAQQKAFNELGKDAVQVSKDMQNNASAAILDILKRISKLPAHARTGMLTQLFGSESVTAISPLLTNLETLEENFKIVGDSARYAGSMQAEFAAANETAAAKAIMMGNAIAMNQIKIGQGLSPTVKDLSDHMNELAVATSDWMKDHPTLTKGVAVFTGAIAVLLVLIGSLLIGFGMLAIAAATVSIGLAPLTLIILGIAALAAAIFLIYDNWGTIIEWLKGFWETIKSATLDAIEELIKAFFNFSPLGMFISALVPVIDYLRNLDFATLGSDLINGLINGLKKQFPRLSATMSWIGGQITSVFSKKMDIHSPSRVFAALGGHVIAGLDQGLSANASDPISRIMGISDQMTRALAIGVGGAAAVAASPAAAATGPAAGSAAPASAAPATYHFHISGTNAADIADQVRATIEQIEREKRGRSFGDD
jgi:TP901 family phage tail tape measure protein